MHWKNLGNYDYLGAYSFDGLAKEVTVTIKSIRKTQVTAPGGSSDSCIVADFEETRASGITIKPMVLNSTNCKTIERIYGTGDIDEWKGKRITIFPTETKFGRDVLPCLRIKAEVPPPAPEYKCAHCGKVITQSFYELSIEKYGVAACSAECLAELKKNENKETK